MLEKKKLVLAILKSMVGLAVLLAGVVCGAMQFIYGAIPLAVIGLAVCLFSYLNLRIEVEHEEENEPAQNDTEG